MNLAVRLALLVVAVLVVVFGLRLRSSFALEQRIADYRTALQTRGLAAERGMESVPTEDVLRERAVAIAGEFALEPSDVSATVERNAAPIGVGGRVAERMGEVDGPRDVDAEGNLMAAPAARLSTTLLEVRVHVHGTGFLCAEDEDIVVRRNLGFAMR